MSLLGARGAPTSVWKNRSPIKPHMSEAACIRADGLKSTLGDPSRSRPSVLPLPPAPPLEN